MSTPRKRAPLSEALVSQWAEDLRNAPTELKHLRRERGLFASTLAEHQIGWDGTRITIPVRDADRQLVNVRRYRRKAEPGSKMRNLTGWGSPTRLAFLDRLPAEQPTSGRRSCVLVAGGEWDALSALQAGFHAVCSTNGEGSLPTADLQRLAGWNVALCLDTDAAGRRAADTWATTLDAVGSVVKVVHLPLDKDINDWFAKHGQTAGDLLHVIKDTPKRGERRDADDLLGGARQQVAQGKARNPTGLWLACQLRDERYSSDEASPVLAAYQASVESLKQPPYTPEEAQSTLRQAYSRPPRSALGASSGDYMLTDYGNAQRFVDRHATDARYVAAHGRWYAWDGRRWAPDETGEVMRWAKATARAMQSEALAVADEEQRKHLAAHAARSESASKLQAMLTLAQSESDVAARADAFDRDSLLLNCRNGVLDLRDARLHDHRREDMCRRLVPVDYDASAPFPLMWDTFLRRVLPDPDVRAFVQRAVGYSLTGSTAEQKLLLLYGLGANGKTTFVEVLQDVLGDYSQQLPPDALMVRTGAIPNDIAKLDGSRFVSATEFDDGARMNEGLIKQLTGGDTISARFLHREWFDFRPQCTIWVSTNHKPIIRGTDDGIWRRFLLVPFTVQIPEGGRDPDLARKLRTELPGILRWAVEGCVAWQREGLNPPALVAAATDQYRNESDLLGQFIEDCCVVDVERSTGKSEMFEAYRSWCHDNELKPATKISFGRMVKERGFDDDRVGKDKTHVWTGLAVRSPVGPDGKIHLSVVTE